MTKLFNPTANDITVQIYGVEYTLIAGGTIDVTEDVAKYWVNELHSFLEEAKTVKEVKKEEVKVDTTVEPEILPKKVTKK